MKVRIDKDKCQGHTRCNMTAPEIFKIDSNGFGYVENETVPPGIEAKARRAAEGCPEQAIIVVE